MVRFLGQEHAIRRHAKEGFFFGLGSMALFAIYPMRQTLVDLTGLPSKEDLPGFVDIFLIPGSFLTGFVVGTGASVAFHMLTDRYAEDVIKEWWEDVF